MIQSLFQDQEQLLFHDYRSDTPFPLLRSSTFYDSQVQINNKLKELYRSNQPVTEDSFKELPF